MDPEQLAWIHTIFKRVYYRIVKKLCGHSAYYVDCRDKLAKSLDPEQTATTGAVLSGFTQLTEPCVSEYIG